jgi:hypothetical protein
MSKTRLRTILIVIAIAIVVLIIWAAYLHYARGYGWATWTGFEEFVGPDLGQGPEYYRGKTLWDWLELLIVPVVLAGGALLFNFSERKSEWETAEKRFKTEREIAEARQQEEVLQNYLDKMTELLLKEGLLAKKDTEDDPVIDVAQVRTVTTLRILGEKRRNILLQFLRDANLIDFLLREASMSEADLSYSDLSNADLSGADLMHTNLSEANLRGANLSEARLILTRLRRAYLNGTNLSGAYLLGADLTDTNLCEANLRGANLSRVHLRGANLSGANLSGADVTLDQLSEAFIDENTTMPDGSKYSPPATPQNSTP